MLFALLLMSTGWLAATPAARAMDPRQPFHSYVLDHWGVEQGLPQITVLDMAEDRAGFLWINTQSAVARFDGARFTRYDRAGTGVDTSMLDAVWADPRGGVWFGGSRGLIEQRDGRFKALGGAAVNAIIDAGDGTPLLATSEGVQRCVKAASSRRATSERLPSACCATATICGSAAPGACAGATSRRRRKPACRPRRRGSAWSSIIWRGRTASCGWARRPA
ncbi:hypothetical protein [Rhodanobacter lindaniclasticus]